MKKYVIALGTFGIAASPLITVVSCSKPKKSKVTEKDETENKGLKAKVDKFVKKYLTSTHDEVKNSINVARKESNNQDKLKESIIKNLSSKVYTSWVVSQPEQKDIELTTIKQTIASILESKLKIGADSPTNYFHHANLYKLSFGKTEIFKEKLEKLDANLDFYKNLNSFMPRIIKIIEGMKGEQTLEDFFKKMPSLISVLKTKLTDQNISENKADEFMKGIYSLDFKISDIKRIHSSLNKIIHNVDFDLSKLRNSKNVLEQVIELTKDKNVILDSKELNEGMQGLISTIADLALRNKDRMSEIISMINIFKPGTISQKFASVILNISKTNIFNEFFNALKNITIEQVRVLEDNILNITKSTDWINFDIFKFITNDKNQERINNILKTLSLGQKTGEIKNIQEIALTLQNIAKKLNLNLQDLIKNKNEGIFNKLVALISSDKFKNLDKQELSKDVSHLIKNLISLISSESNNIDNIIELINSLKPNLISPNMKKIITIIVKSDVMKDLAQVKEETLNKILHLDFSVDDILGLLKKWLKLPKDASFIDVFKGLSGTLKQIGVLSDKQIETMNKLVGSDFVTKALSKPGVIKKLKEIFEYNFKKINLNFLVKIIKDFKETKNFKVALTNVLKVLVNDKSNLKSIKLIATESINYLLTIDNEKFTNINDLLKLVKKMGLISADMAKKIKDTLNDASFKEFVINNPDLIKSVKAMLLNPLKHPKAKALVQKIVKDLINKDREELIKDAKQYFVYGKGLDKNMQAIFTSFVTKVLVLDNGKLANVNLLLETYIKAKPNSELAKKLGIILNSKFVKDILNQPKVIAKVKEMILQNADKLTLASVKKIIDLMKNGKSNEVTQFIIKTILEDENNIDNLKLIVNEGMDYLLTIKNAEFVNINNLLEFAKQMKLVSEETITKLKSAISNPMFKAFVVNNKNIIQILKDLLLKPLESQNAKLIIQKMIQDLINKDHEALIQDAINYFAEGSKDGTLGAALQKVFKSFVTKVLLTDNQGRLTNIDLLVGTLIKMNPKSKLLGKLKTILNSKFAKDIFKQKNVIAKIKEILNYNIDKLNLEGIKKMINLVKGKKYGKITEIIFKSALEDETNHKNIQLIITESINYLLTINNNNNKFSNLNELLKSLSNSGFMSKKLVAKISKIINTPLVEKLIQDEKGFVDAIIRLVNDNFASLTEEQILNIFIALKNKNYSLLTKNILKANLFANAQSVEDLKLILEKITEFILAKNSENKIGDNIKLLLDAMKKYGLFSDKITKIEAIMNTDIIKALLTDKNVNDSIKKLIDINIKKLSVEKVKEIFEAFSQGKLKETLVKIVNKDVLEDADSVAEINVVIKSMLTFALKISDKKEFANLNQLLESLKFIKSLSKPITSFQKMLKSDLFIDLSKRDGFITALTELIKINIGNFDSASTKKILNLMTKKDYAGMINALVESNLSNPEAMKHLSAIVGIVIDYALTLNDKGELGNLSKILKLVGENSKFGKIITVITDNLTKDGFFKNFLANKKDFILNFKKTLKSVATKLMEPGMLNKVMGILKGDGKISVKLKTLWNTTGIFSKEDKEFITDTLKAIIATLGSVLANDKLSLNDIKEAINKIKIDGSIKNQMLQFISLFLTKGEKDASIQSVIKKLHNVVIHINPKKLLSILDILEDKKISKKDKFLRILEMPDLILDKDNKDHVHKDLKGLTKELTINVLTNMLDGGNLNHYKESFELFGIKLNKSKWDNITNLLKFAFTGNDGKFDYAKVRGFIKAIVDNANLDINSIQKVINYFASDAFSLKVKNSTGILGKARLFFSIINQKDILAMMKDKKKFISSINKFGLFIVKNVIDKLGDKSQIEVNAQTFTKLGLFSSIKNARIILKGLISTFKDLKIMINDQGKSDGKTKENHLAYAGNYLGIMLLNTWLNHRYEIAKAFDDTKSDEWKKKHITYTEVVKFISDLSGRKMVGTSKSEKKDQPLWVHLSWILSLEKEGSLIKMTLGQLLFIANYDENGERAEGDNIYKKIDKITENWKGSMNGVDSLFANLSKMHKILENNHPSFLITMDILSQGLTFGTLLKDSYFHNEKIKKLLRDWIVGLGFAKEGERILTRDRDEWTKKVQTAVQSLLHDLLYMKIGIGEDLFDLTTLNTFLKNPLLNKILKMLKI